jgi:hypothetical protein
MISNEKRVILVDLKKECVMPVDKNSEDYKKGIDFLTRMLSNPHIRAVSNVLEFDTGSASAIVNASNIGFLTRQVIGPEVEYDATHIKILLAHNRTMPKEGQIPDRPPFSNPDQILRITVGGDNRDFINGWLSALRDASSLANKSGKNLNLSDINELSDEQIAFRHAKHKLIKALAEGLTTPGLRARGNVIELDTHSNQGFVSISEIRLAIENLDKGTKKYPATDQEPASAPAPTIDKQKAIKNNYFANDAYIARMTIGRFSPEVRAAWKTALQEAQIRAKAIDKTIDYQDAPEVATDADGPGCLSAVPKAAMDWVRKMAGRQRGSSGERGAS